MKRSRFILYSFLILCYFISINIIKAQSPYDITATMMQASIDDAGIFLNEYMSPLDKAWSASMANSWYNTAQTHETGSFEIIFNYSWASTPEIDKTFDIQNVGLTAVNSVDGNTVVPTIVNSEISNNIKISSTNNISLNDTVYTLSGFNAPNGIPLPTFNIGIGIYKNTDFVGRLIPNSAIGDFGAINLWGFGVKHDILQWLPFVDEIPFKAAIQFGFTKFNMNYGLNYSPSADRINVQLPENQELKMKITNLTGNIILSKKIYFATPYLSVGFSKTSLNMIMDGTYYFALNNQLTGISEINDSDEYRFIDPINIKPEPNIQTQFTAGLRLKFLVLTMHAQYSFQEYGVFTAGVGISVN
ncbi:MAG: hypothetical protein GXO79_13040 [Chlorobi bacterium]|nr:hypothetical protein [Chlorobiota bacterium]